MRRFAAPLAGLAALVALAGGCSSSGSGASSASAAASDTTTTTAPSTTTTVPLTPQKDPTAAAGTFMSAWKAGDEATARTVAVGAAVDAVFAAGAPGSVQARGCSTAQFDPAQCVYKTNVGEVQVRTTQQNGGWIVDQARVTPG